MREELLSVGIDIGTSTTQLVFSRLIIQNMASNYTVPRIIIVGKEVIYKSDIYLTPFLSNYEIDGKGVKEIATIEYKKANIRKEQIQTGAVIITGETARKNNAKEVLEQLSEFAGDFVVATAGPDLESIISGKGAGAHLYAKEHHTTVVNIDIGGGTSNLVLFSNGVVEDTGCFDIGGRLIKVDKESHKILYISEKLKQIIEKKRIHLFVGKVVTKEELQPVIDCMVYALEASVGLREREEEFPLFITNKTLSCTIPISFLSFSGGVADFIYENKKVVDDFEYGDIGVLLGRAIQQSRLCTKIKVLKSQETIRATVVGAGSHTTEISGSTITYTKDAFPIKNLPILKLTLGKEIKAHTIAEEIKRKLEWFELEEGMQEVAFAFQGKKNPSFAEIKEYAAGLLGGIKSVHSEKKLPIIVIVEEDMAKVLGQTLYHMLSMKEDVICLDGISLQNGDYIDIGCPIADGTVLPVVVKTLVFSESKEHAKEY